MGRQRYWRLFLFLKICAATAVLYFLLYFMLDLALAAGLSFMEKQYESDLSGFNAGSKRDARISDISSTIELENAVRNSGFTLRSMEPVEKGGGLDSFSSLTHQFLESVLETPDDLLEPPEERLLEYMRLMEENALGIRGALLAGTDPVWAGDNTGEIDQLKVSRIGEWLAAQSLRDAGEGRIQDSALFAEALNRLSLSLLRERNQNCWLTAVSLGQTYAGVARKIGRKHPGIKPPEIAPYEESLRGTILTRMERLIRGTRRMEKIHHYRIHRRELIVWRTYGRLWYRYSLMREIKARHRDYLDSLDFLSCGKLSPVRTGRMKKSVWMTNGGEFRLEDMRYRLQKLAFSFEFTGWVLSGKSSPEKGLLSCPPVRARVEEKDGKRTISFDMPFGMKKRDGVIDLPTSFTYPEQLPDN